MVIAEDFDKNYKYDYSSPKCDQNIKVVKTFRFKYDKIKTLISRKDFHYLYNSLFLYNPKINQKFFVIFSRNKVGKVENGKIKSELTTIKKSIKDKPSDYAIVFGKYINEDISNYIKDVKHVLYYYDKNYHIQEPCELFEPLKPIVHTPNLIYYKEKIIEYDEEEERLKQMIAKLDNIKLNNKKPESKLVSFEEVKMFETADTVKVTNKNKYKTV